MDWLFYRALYISYLIYHLQEPCEMGITAPTLDEKKKTRFGDICNLSKVIQATRGKGSILTLAWLPTPFLSYVTVEDIMRNNFFLFHDHRIWGWKKRLLPPEYSSPWNSQLFRGGNSVGQSERILSAAYSHLQRHKGQ